MSHTPEELLIVTLADMLQGDRHVAVGAASPIPGAAALLAKSEASRRMHVSILHSLRHNPFAEGARELFDAAGPDAVEGYRKVLEGLINASDREDMLKTIKKR